MKDRSESAMILTILFAIIATDLSRHDSPLLALAMWVNAGGWCVAAFLRLFREFRDE